MWATEIAERYMGKKNADEYGKRNSGDGYSPGTDNT